MDEPKTLNHSKWECKYHVVFIPKYRKKSLYVELRPHLGEIFRNLAKRKECEIEEGHVMADHIHMLIAIPPKYAVSQIIGYIKGKAAIQIARQFGVLEFFPRKRTKTARSLALSTFPEGVTFSKQAYNPRFCSLSRQDQAISRLIRSGRCLSG